MSALERLRQASLRSAQHEPHSRRSPSLEGGSASAERSHLDRRGRASLGWDLYKANKAQLAGVKVEDLAPDVIRQVRGRLFDYLKLGINAPDLLHTCIMTQALRLSRNKHINLVQFLKLWGAENFRSEDWTASEAPDGRVFPPLAEQVIQHASKTAAKGERRDEIEFVLPHLERAMESFPENIWLKYNKVKLLRLIDQVDAARELAIEFARWKSGDYWTWDLLGDLEVDPAMRLACCAKALSCSEDDTYLGKVRLKFAELVRERHPGHAKTEVERVVAQKTAEGKRVPDDALRMVESAWFRDATPAATGKAFYAKFARPAEDLLFSHLPWAHACLGDEFVQKGKDGRQDRTRRRIYVAANPAPLEAAVSDRHPSVRGRPPGTPIRIQMEAPPEQPWRTTVHRIEPRGDGAAYDVFPELCGVVDRVNHGKGVFHFIIAKDLDGVHPLSMFEGAVEPGMFVAVRMARHHALDGMRSRVVAVSPTARSPGKDVCDTFADVVRLSKGMGFTSSGLFIPPPLVISAGIADGDHVEGLAVIQFDTRKGKWSWAAVRVRVLAARDAPATDIMDKAPI